MECKTVNGVLIKSDQDNVEKETDQALDYVQKICEKAPEQNGLVRGCRKTGRETEYAQRMLQERQSLPCIPILFCHRCMC